MYFSWLSYLSRIVAIFFFIFTFPFRKYTLSFVLVDPQEVNSKFKELLKATGDSPWRFSALLAHCFGLDVVPPGLFNTLKLSLLLSLVQTGADAKNTVFNLDLLVTADDKLIVYR